VRKVFVSLRTLFSSIPSRENEIDCRDTRATPWKTTHLQLINSMLDFCLMLSVRVNRQTI